MNSSSSLADKKHLKRQEQIKMRSARLREAIDNAGGFKYVSEETGIPPQTLKNYADGRDIKVSLINDIATACKVSVFWLMTGDSPDNFSCNSQSIHHNDEHEYFTIPYITSYDSILNDKDMLNIIPERNYKLPENFISKILYSNKNNLFFLKINEDSMNPTIKFGNIILVDRKKTSVVNGIYLVSIHNFITLKRIALHKENTFSIISDNPIYPRYEIEAEKITWEENSHLPIKIIGKVCALISRPVVGY